MISSFWSFNKQNVKDTEENSDSQTIGS
jgi:hypothetical protein